MTLLADAELDLLVYEPMLSAKTFVRALVQRNLSDFKEKSDIAIANRISEDLKDIELMVFFRDLFNKD